MEIRREGPGDQKAIRLVHCSAFPTDAEARIVERLRDAEAAVASTVAVTDDGAVVGHALFSTARIDRASGSQQVAALGPVGVLAERQGQGIGSMLIRAGMQRCWSLGLPGIVVLGRPEYYERFGFDRADAWDVRCEFDVPPEAFMVAWADAPVRGPAIAHYHAAFRQG